ncbi:hypothetical protein HanHA89_Chr11g0411161 [Helianthus annuus]|nr:hypothetical protein HanHA89_Chr11g0411161 [Helianthus annuus]
MNYTAGMQIVQCPHLNIFLKNKNIKRCWYHTSSIYILYLLYKKQHRLPLTTFASLHQKAPFHSTCMHLLSNQRIPSSKCTLSINNTTFTFKHFRKHRFNKHIYISENQRGNYIIHVYTQTNTFKRTHPFIKRRHFNQQYTYTFKHFKKHRFNKIYTFRKIDVAIILYMFIHKPTWPFTFLIL